MKVSYAITLLVIVAAAVAGTSPSSDGHKSTVVPSLVQPSASYPESIEVPYPARNNQFATEYNTPFAKSAYSPKAAVPSSFGTYQPYHQPYNFGPYQQQYFPGSGYSGPYSTAYSSQSAPLHPTAYSAYPYAAQPYHGGYSSYPSGYQSYNGQFFGPSAPSYNSHFAATPYSAIPSSAYSQQPLHSSFYNSAAGQQYNPSQQQFQSQQFPFQQYPAFYPNSPAIATSVSATADSSKPSAEKK